MQGEQVPRTLTTYMLESYWRGCVALFVLTITYIKLRLISSIFPNVSSFMFPFELAYNMVEVIQIIINSDDFNHY